MQRVQSEAGTGAEKSGQGSDLRFLPARPHAPSASAAFLRLSFTESERRLHPDDAVAGLAGPRARDGVVEAQDHEAEHGHADSGAVGRARAPVVRPALCGPAPAAG